MSNFRIGTARALLIALGLLFVGFVFAAFKPTAPYGEYAAAVVAVFTGYGYKRLAQKQEKYGATPVSPKEDTPNGD